MPPCNPTFRRTPGGPHGARPTLKGGPHSPVVPSPPWPPSDLQKAQTPLPNERQWHLPGFKEEEITVVDKVMVADKQDKEVWAKECKPPVCIWPAQS